MLRLTNRTGADKSIASGVVDCLVVSESATYGRIATSVMVVTEPGPVGGGHSIVVNAAVGVLQFVLIPKMLHLANNTSADDTVPSRVIGAFVVCQTAGQNSVTSGMMGASGRAVGAVEGTSVVEKTHCD